MSQVVEDSLEAESLREPEWQLDLSMLLDLRHPHDIQLSTGLL